MTFSEALASAEEQYQQQRVAYVAALSPERVEAIQRNDSEAKADRTPHHYRAGARARRADVAVPVCWGDETD